MRYEKVLAPVGSLGLLLVVVGGILFVVFRVLGLPLSELADWGIGLAMFWWLIVIVTIPWSLYFQAKSVRNEADLSQQKGIPVDPETLGYLEKLTIWSLRIAIGLHLLSAFGFYVLALWQIAPIGYASSVAALLLTGLRPGIQGYEYLAARLSQMEQRIKIPREDAIELAHGLRLLKEQVKRLEESMDPQREGSWAQKLEATSTYLRRETATLIAQLERQQASNQLEHEQLKLEAQQAISRLSEDSRFLGHVREIIRFIKE